MSMDQLYFSLGIFFYLLLSFGCNNGAAPNGSLISHLPGFNGTFPSKHYSGYVTFDEKNLFYYFVVSERNQSKDPVVLWLNGGPGCSSFDGFIYEHGPFNYEEAKETGGLPTRSLNPHSWSKVSNIVYLDSPCGVGLSYSSNSTKYITTDLQTAADTHSFLLKWFQLFPEFVKNPFYISGESYAGVYVPTLAHQVVEGIKSGAKPVINFKGYLVGNGVSNSNFDEFKNNLLPFAHGMGLISDEIFEEVQSACKENANDPPPIDDCDKSLAKVFQAFAGLNRYAILEPCDNGPTDRQTGGAAASARRPRVSKVMFVGRAWRPFQVPRINGGDQGGVNCINDEAAWTWLNDEAVRKAIHAQPGDHDLVVPFVGSQAWTRSLGYKKIDEWRPWMSSNQQVAGYVQGYDNNLTFLTVKGAGHMVPQYKPGEALDFYSRWLDGKPI